MSHWRGPRKQKRQRTAPHACNPGQPRGAVPSKGRGRQMQLCPYLWFDPIKTSFVVFLVYTPNPTWAMR